MTTYSKLIVLFRSFITASLGLISILVVLVLICLTSPTDPVTAEPWATATAYVWPPPTYDPVVAAREDWQDLEKVMKLLQPHGIDLFCTPPCWGNLKPGTSTMKDVYQWFDTLFPKNGPISPGNNKRDLNAPNNMMGIGVGAFSLDTFSDDSQPEPSLRAFSFRFGTRRGIAESEHLPQIHAWLPENVLRRAGLPQHTVWSDRQGHYYWLLDYKDWAVEYSGRDTFFPDTNTHRACPLAVGSPVGIKIWVYSDNEDSAIALLRSLASYDNSKAYGNVVIPDNSDLHSVVGMKPIVAYIGKVVESGCLPDTTSDPKP